MSLNRTIFRLLLLVPLILSAFEYHGLANGSVEATDSPTATVVPVFGISSGGISPQSLAKPISQLTTIKGAYYDQDSGELVIIGVSEPNLPVLRLDDFLVALRAMYSGEYPAVSIDPGSDPNAMDVRYWGQTENTHFGLVMFEADRLLKVLSMGRDNVTGRLLRSDVSGYQTYLQRAVANYSPDSQSDAWFRMWFEPSKTTLLTSDDRLSVSLDSPSMIARTEFLPPATGIDPNASAFVEHLNQNYQDYAGEQPVLDELVQLEQWLILAKWLRDSSIEIDFSFLTTFAPETVETPTQTPTIEVSESFVQGNYWISLGLYGGVDFRFPEDNYEVNASAVDALIDSAKSARPDAVTNTWEVTIDSATYSAVAMSPALVTRPGSFPLTENDLGTPISLTSLSLNRYYDSFSTSSGILGHNWSHTPLQMVFPEPYDLYEGHPRRIDIYDHISHVVQSYQLCKTDSGDLVYYADYRQTQAILSFTANGTYTLTRQDGISVQFDGSGQLITVEDDAGHKLDYAYSSSNQLQTITDLDGQQIKLDYDGKGRIRSAVGPENVTLTYQYDGQDDLIQVRGSRGYLRSYTYTDHRLTQIRDDTGLTTIENLYDALGRLTSQKRGDSDFTFQYEKQGRQLTITDLNAPDNVQIYEFDGQGRIVSLEQFDNPPVSYSYDDVGPLPVKVSVAGNELTFEYDWQGKLISQQLPDNRTIAFNYTPDGYLASTQDSSETNINFERNDEGKLVRIIKAYDRTESRFEFVRDEDGKLTSIRLPTGEVRDLVAERRFAAEVNQAVITSVDIYDHLQLALVIIPDGNVIEIELTPERFASGLFFVRPDLVMQQATLSFNTLWNQVPDLLGRNIDRFLPLGPVVVMAGELDNVNYNQVFPGRVVTHLPDRDVERALRNASFLTGLQLKPNNSSLLVGIPSSEEEIQAVGLNDSFETWDGLKSDWITNGARYGYKGNTGADSFNSAVQNSQGVLVVIAHGDGDTIYWPDGSQTTTSDIENLRPALEANHPLIILFSCQAAKFDEGPKGLVQTFLESGAGGVVAPTTDITAGAESQTFFDFLLRYSAQGLTVLDALQAAQRSVQYDALEIWILSPESIYGTVRINSVD